jgi:hypothetical protein
MTHTLYETDGARVTVYLDAPDWVGAPTAALGAFTCKTAEAGGEVLANALSHIREQGIDRVIGPMEGDTWHSYRFVTESDGSPAFMLEPPDKPLCRDVLLRSGFTQISSYFSARVRLPQTEQAEPEETDAFAIETWDGTEPEALFDQVFALSTEAFSKNAFYKPITRDAFLAMYVPLVPMLKRELIFFARRPDGSLAGFLFGVPNYAEGPASRTAILKTYASLEKGAGRHLAHAFHTTAAAAGYDTAIHALIHDDNLSALRSATEGAHVFRRYGLFGMRMDE